MRRRKTKKINFFLILILLLTVVSVSYAYLSSSLNITGQITGNYLGDEYVIDPTGNPNLSISTPIINKWGNNEEYGYQYQFNIKNNGNIDYDNFKIILTYNSNINTVNIWDYEYELNNKVINIINTTRPLKAAGSLEVTFIVQTNEASLKLMKIKLYVETQTSEIDPSKFEVVFVPVNSWGNYVYQYDVKLTNKTGMTINYWQVDVTLPSNTFYHGGWNAIFETNNSILTIKNTSHNGRIDNNASTTIGLQIETNIINFIPSNYKIMVR